jgi:hypothetical protein
VLIVESPEAGGRAVSAFASSRRNFGIVKFAPNADPEKETRPLPQGRITVSDPGRWSKQPNTGRESQVENEAGLKNGRPEWTRTIDLFRVKEAL